MALYQGGQRNFPVLDGPTGSVRIDFRKLSPWGPERRGIVWKNFGLDQITTMLNFGTDIQGISNRFAGTPTQVTRRWGGRRRNPDSFGDSGFGGDSGGGVGGFDRPLERGQGMSEGGPPGGGAAERQGSSGGGGGAERTADPFMASAATTAFFSPGSPSAPTPTNASDGTTPTTTVANPGGSNGGPPQSVLDQIKSLLPAQQGALGTTVAGTGTSPILLLLLLGGMAAVGYWAYHKYVKKG